MAATGMNCWMSPLLRQDGRLLHVVTRNDRDLGMVGGECVGEAVNHRRDVCRQLGLSFDRLTVGEQVHGTRIATVTADGTGCGRDALATRVRGTDGLVTDVPGVPLMVLGADCGLVLAFDPLRPAIGVAHAGWRGTAQGMGRAIIDDMTACFSSRPADLRVAISPCAHMCCYQVRDDVLEAFGRHGETPVVRRDGRLVFLDLAATLARQLESSGVPGVNIDAAEACTICSADYFSYRRDGAPAGRFALIAALDEAAMLGSRRPRTR